MANENSRLPMLYSTNRASQEKFAYYMLAIGAAAIAFSVQLTFKQTLQYEQIPLAFAVVLWACSFYCGIQHLQRAELAMIINSIELRYVERIENKEAEASEEKMNHLKKSFNYHSLAGAKFRKLQVRCLIWGGMAFFIYHLTHMAVLTYYTDPAQ